MDSFTPLVSTKNKNSKKDENGCPVCTDINHIHLHHGSSGQQIYMIFHALMSMIAMYLSYRCNNKTFNLTNFVMALLFPYPYILYTLSTQGTCGILE